MEVTQGIFLQARLNSSRLPRKALLKLGELTLLEWAMRALCPVTAQVRAVLTDKESLPELEPLAEKWGWKVFSGDPENVLMRFVAASEAFGTDVILRATGDNPWVSADIAERNLSKLTEGGWDLYALAYSPLGTGTEAVRADALAEALSGNPDVYEREHVTPFLYRRPQRFRFARPSVPPFRYYPEGRVTVDTEQDFFLLSKILEEAGFTQAPEPEDMIPYLKIHA